MVRPRPELPRTLIVCVIIFIFNAPTALAQDEAPPARRFGKRANTPAQEAFQSAAAPARAQNPRAQAPLEDVGGPAADVPREKLRYAMHNFDEWRATLEYDLDPTARSQAIDALGILGSRGYQQEAAALLGPLLKLNSDDAANKVPPALARLGEPGVEPLRQYLADKDNRNRAFSARALGTLGPRARPAIAALVEATRDPDIHCRKEAVEALGRIGVASGEVIDAVIVAADEFNPLLYRECAKALVRLRAKTEPARDVIRKLSPEPNSVSRLAQVILDEEIDVDDAVVIPLLVKTLERLRTETNANRFGGTEAPELFMALGKLGPRAADAVSALAEFLKPVAGPTRGRQRNPDDVLREQSLGVPSYTQNALWAAQALAKLGPAAAPAVPQLIASLESDLQVFESGRIAVSGINPATVEALSAIGPAATDAVTTLERLKAALEVRKPSPEGAKTREQRIEESRLRRGFPSIEDAARFNPRSLRRGPAPPPELTPETIQAAIDKINAK